MTYSMNWCCKETRCNPHSGGFVRVISPRSVLLSDPKYVCGPAPSTQKRRNRKLDTLRLRGNLEWEQLLEANIYFWHSRLLQIRTIYFVVLHHHRGVPPVCAYSTSMSLSLRAACYALWYVVSNIITRRRHAFKFCCTKVKLFFPCGLDHKSAVQAYHSSLSLPFVFASPISHPSPALIGKPAQGKSPGWRTSPLGSNKYIHIPYQSQLKTPSLSSLEGVPPQFLYATILPSSDGIHTV